MESEKYYYECGIKFLFLYLSRSNMYIWKHMLVKVKNMIRFDLKTL